VRWVLQLKVSKPIVDLGRNRDMASYSQCTKLEMMIALLYKGFEASAAGWIPAYAPSSAKVFLLSNLYRATEYWQAFSDHRRIFAAVFLEIPHTMPQAFYRCLLQLRQERLSDLWHMDWRHMGAKAFMLCFCVGVRAWWLVLRQARCWTENATRSRTRLSKPPARCRRQFQGTFLSSKKSRLCPRSSTA